MVRLVVVAFVMGMIVPELASADPPAGAATASSPTYNRLGVEVGVFGGHERYVSAAGSLHYERGLAGTWTGIVRVEAALLLALLGEGSDRLPVAATGGARAYFGPRGYVEGEIGVAIVYQGGYDDGLIQQAAQVRFAPAGRLGVGAHLGRFDVGITLNATALGIGARIGGDFAAW